MGYIEREERQPACPCQQPPAIVEQLIRLEVVEGRLYARLSTGRAHVAIVTAHTRDGLISVGCVKVSRDALDLLNKEVSRQDEFQRKNSAELMKRIAPVKK